MNQKYTAAMMQDAECWLGWIEEVPGIHCHEHSREALQNSLMVMLKNTLLFNRQETFHSSEVSFKDKG